MKQILMVKHANGTAERLCPKCNQVMTFHEGGFIERFDGSYYQHEIPDDWHCENCGMIINSADEYDLELAFCEVA